VNVPQESPKALAFRQVREVRREIAGANPALPPEYAHHLAMQVVAFRHFVARDEVRPYQDRTDVSTQQRHSGGYFGDLNDPSNPYSPLHPHHPVHHMYGDGGRQDGDFVSQYGGRDRIEDHAYSRGYQGKYPHLYGAGDKALNHVVDFFRNRRNAPPPTSNAAPSPGAQDVLPGGPAPRMIPHQPQGPAPVDPPTPSTRRGRPAPPVVPNKRVQDPQGYARDVRNEKARKRRQQKSNGTGDLGDFRGPSGKGRGRPDTFGLTGALATAFPTITLEAEKSPEYNGHYRRGWASGNRGVGGLDRADSRREPEAWYDGYYDAAAGREKFHLRDHQGFRQTGTACPECGG
jgi:hypothetical protein